MSDKDFKIGISTHADTSGANEAEESVVKVTEATDKLNESSDQSTKSTDEQTKAVDKLTKTTEENTEAVNPMREGWDEYVEAQEKAKEAAQENTETISDQTAALRRQKETMEKVNAEAKKNRKVSITQVGNDQIKVGKLTKLKNGISKVTKVAGKGLKLAGRAVTVFGLVTKSISLLGAGFDKAGKGIKSFGDDMKLVGAQGAGAVQWIGKASSAVGGWIKKVNFIGNYIDGVRYAAEEQRKLNKALEEEERRLKKTAAQYSDHQKKIDELTRQSKSYNKAVRAKEEAQRKYNKQLAEANRLLQRQRELSGAKHDRSEAAIDANERFEIAQLEAQGLDPEKEAIKRREIEEKFTQKRYDLEQKRNDDELKFINQEIEIKRVAAQKDFDEIARLTQDNQVAFLSNDERALREQLIEEKEKKFQSLLAERNLLSRKEGKSSTDEKKEAELTDQLQSLDASIKLSKQSIKDSDRLIQNAGFEDGDSFHAEVKRLSDRRDQTQQEMNDLKHERKLIKFRDKTQELEEKSRRNSQAIQHKTFTKEQNKRAKEKADNKQKAEQAKRDNEARDIVDDAENIGDGLNLSSEFRNGIDVLQAKLKNGADDKDKKQMLALLNGLIRHAISQQGRDSAITEELRILKSRFNTLSNQGTRGR